MPLPTTFAGTSARGEGLFASKGGTYYAYTTNNGNTLQKINLSTLSVSSSLSGFNGPKQLAINSTGSFAYVPNSSGNSVLKVNLSSFTIVSGSVSTGPAPYWVALDPTNTYGYTANFDFGNTSSNTITKFAISTFSLVSSISVGYNAICIAIDSTGTNAYFVLNNSVGTSSLNRIALSSFTWNSSLSVGINSSCVAIDPSNTYAYVANTAGTGVASDSSITKVNLSTMTKVGSNLSLGGTGSGRTPYGIAINPAGTFAYTANQDSTVSKINLSSFTVSSTLTGISGTPNEITIDSTGTFAYVASNTTVTKINLSTFTVDSSVAVTNATYGIALSPVAV
jgi:DNA-binding beta-propeller fold protein YncE